jgi:hypothetical protein
MKRLTRLAVATLGLAAAGSAMAYSRGDAFIDYARVDRVDRLLEAGVEPQTRRECWDRPRTEYHPGTEYRRETVVPGYDADGDRDDRVVRSDVVETGGYTTTETERVCQTNTASVETRRVIGYDVVYSYRGEDYHERLDHDPGRSVRVLVDHGYVAIAE